MTETFSDAQPNANRYLQGNFAPVADEITLVDLDVIGVIPPELDGRYVRTGPNPTSVDDPANYHWFIGDGMVHGIELGGGRARSYRNRWVRSPEIIALLGEDEIERPATVGPFPGSGNTNVIHHAGAIWAINELSLPYELSQDLDTLRQWDFGGPLPAGMNAHPKFDPATGEMHVMAYDLKEPYLRYQVIDASGIVIRSESIAVGGQVMVHDMALTESRAIAFDLPVLFNLESAMSGATLPYRWDDEYTPRVGLVPRAGKAEDTIWIEVDPCYIFHALNAYDDEDGTIVVDLVRHPAMFRTITSGPDEGTPVLERWRLDPVSRSVSTSVLDDRAQEFPRADERLAGQRHRYGYCLGGPLATLAGLDDSHTALLKHDVERGVTMSYDFGPGRVGGEFVFVPSDVETSAEDEGWLMGYVYDRSTDTSDFMILDAHDFGGPPLATVKLPRRIPAGFHGNWIPDRAIN